MQLKERSWATVGQALSRADIPVVESDQDRGVYQISVPADLSIEEEEPGFFSRMFSFGEEDVVELQLSISDAGDGTFVVNVLDAEGQALADRLVGRRGAVIRKGIARHEVDDRRPQQRNERPVVDRVDRDRHGGHVRVGRAVAGDERRPGSAGCR